MRTNLASRIVSLALALAVILSFVPTDLVSATSAVDQEASAYATAGTPGASAPMLIHFYNADKVDNTKWTGSRLSNLKVDTSNGILSATASGSDPYVYYNASLGYTISSGDIIEVSIKTTVNNYVDIYFTSEGKGYADNKVIRGNKLSTDANQFSCYEFSLGTEEHKGKTINNLRLDPLDTLNATFQVDYIYIGPKEWAPSCSRRIIHFYGDAMGDISNWGTSCIADDTLTVEQENSVINGTTNGTDPYIYTNNSLNYPIKSGDVVEVRMKTNVSSIDPRIFFQSADGGGYTTNCTASGLGKSNQPTYAVNEFSTYQFSLSGKVGKTITVLRLDPFAGNTGHTFSVDYIYIGPASTAPSTYKNFLLFDFDQNEEGEYRYSSEAYGDRDFNSSVYSESDLGDTGVWYINGHQISNVNIADGTAAVEAISGNQNSNVDGLWGYISTANCLRYYTNPGDIVQVKLKTVDMQLNADSELGLRFYARSNKTTTATGVDRANSTVIPVPKTLIDNTDYVFQANLIDLMIDADYLTAARIQWFGLEAVAGKTGKVLIDYIYVGPAANAPGTQSSYSVKYNANSGTGSMANSTHYFGVAKNLTSNAFTKTGYDFKGWATSSGSSTVTYTNGKSVSNLTNVPGATVNLYAVWQIKTFKVTFVDYNGTVLKEETVNYNASATPPANPTRAKDSSNHYTFAGWQGTYTNVKSAVTIKATYTATPHSYTDSYAKITNDTVNHTAKCSCGATKTESHSYNSGVVNSQAGCASTGTKTYTCTKCGQTKTESIPATGHSYTSKVTAPTCTAQGYTTYTCSVCGHSYKDNYVNAPGHSYSYKVTKDPTTSATGTLTGTCSKCNGTVSIELPKLNTTAYTYKVEKAASCTAKGVGRYTWNTKTYGTFYFDVDIPVIAHSYTSKVTAPACTAQGYTTYTCSACGHSYKDNYVNATGHVNTSTKVTDATCTKEGSVVVTCACGVVVSTEVVAALGHSYKSVVTAPTCTATGYTTHTCSGCGHSYQDSEKPALGHSYDDGKITTYPTLTSKGIMTYTCQRSGCGDSYKVSIDELRNELFFDFGNGTNDKTRYENASYNFHNFDDEETIRWQKGPQLESLSINNQQGTLTVKATSASNTGLRFDSAVDASNHLDSLHFDPSEAFVYQIRFKMTDFARVEETNPYVSLHLWSGGAIGENKSEVAVIPVEYLNSGEYVILTGVIPQKVRDKGIIQSVRAYFGNVTNASGKQGTLTVDYIYIGSQEGVPGKKDLYFTFDNAPEDQVRYDSKTYGYVQFDEALQPNWSGSDKLLTGVGIADGALTLNVRGKYDDSVTSFAAYADSVTKNNANPLFYDPSNAEVWQIRFKMESMVKTSPPYVDLHLWGLDHSGNVIANAGVLNMPNAAIPESKLTDGQYIVITVPVPADANGKRFAGCEVITKARAYFGQVKGADPDNGGKITIDYIYLGTEENLPTPRYTVTFKNADGSALGSVLVHRGETAVYPGAKNPSKSSTSSKHYIFNGWDQALTNVQNNMTVTAVYKEENHKYSYEVTKEPTVEAAGTLKGTCSVCEQQETIALPKLDETNYTKKEVKATSCTEKGEYEYTWKTTQYGTYTFKDYPDAFGHDYGSSVTKPDCENPGHTTYTCKRCGFTYDGDEVGALGHTKVVDPAVAPTCIATGLTEGSHCAVCGKVLVAQQIVDAQGHDEVIDEAVKATCTTTGLTEGKHCIVCGTVLLAQQETPALGHTHAAPVNNGNGTHSSICRCGDTITEVHSFDENGNCICGASNKVGLLEADAIDVVVDYARPIEVSVRNRAFISAVTEEMLAKAPMTAALAKPSDSAYGTVTAFDSDGDGLDDSLRFVPTGFLPGIVTVNCTFKVYFATAKVTQDVIVPVRFIPATSVYYETDFSDSALTRYPAADWITKGEIEKKDQDSGIIKENIYDFVFDRGGEIPSNAFFADFSNDTVRYNKSPVYANTGSNGGGTSYDAVTDGATGVVKNWTAGQTTTPKIWWAAGRMSLDFTGTSGHLWLKTNGTLSYHPEPTHYVQVRFRMRNIVSTNADGTGTLEMRYYTPDNMSASAPPVGGQGVIPARAYTDGEYVTVSFPLSSIGPAVTTIASIRLDFRGIAKKSENVNGNLMIDYIYCGPDNSQETHLSKTDETAAINSVYELKSDIPASQYLFYDFTGNALDTERYTSAQYKGVNYDAGGKWVVSTSSADGKTDKIYTSTHNDADGTMGPNIGRKQNDAKTMDICYVAPTTGGNSGFPHVGQSYSSLYTLDFSPNRSLSYVCIVRFKLVECAQRSNTTPQLNCTLIDEKYTPASNATDGKTFTFADVNNKFGVVTIPLNNGLKTTGKIKNFYLRFTNVRNASTSTPGKIVIDYIYIGPSNYTVADARRAESNSVFVDFNNTAYDKARYAGDIYGGVNFDNLATVSGHAARWTSSGSTIGASGGIFTMTPTATSGYAGVSTQFAWDNNTKVSSNRDSMMNYTLPADACAVVRMKYTGVASGQSPKLTFTFSDNQVYNAGTKYTKSAAFKGGNDVWSTYLIDLSEDSGKLLRYFQIGFSNLTSYSGVKIQIDYFYIGQKLNAAPPEDTIYFGFENTGADQTRYSSATYGNINYDDPVNVNKFGFVNLASASIDNVNGTMTMVARPESTYSTFGFAPGNTLKYHPKDKTVQMRFKLEDFVLYGDSDPYVLLQYGDNNTRAGIAYFSKKWVTNGKYVTVTLDLTEAVAADFNNINVTNKMRFIVGGIKNADNMQGKIILDYAYIGPKDGKLGGEMTYGYDSHYTSDNGFSGGSSYFVNGKGVPNLLALKDENGQFVRDENNQLIITGIDYPANGKYTEATFTFTGKGFDFIGNTGPEQGSVRAAVFDKETGKFVKSTQVVCTSESGKDVTQVPVISMTLDAHGTYTVKISVAEGYKNDDFPFLNRGGEFHFDAIRIYDTVNTEADTTEAEIATDVYRKHGEAHAEIEEIRQYLIDAQKFSQLEGSTEGAIFLDNTSKEVTVSTYQELGPNNEVYLNSGFAISFLLEASYGIPASVDIGAKLVNGTASQMGIAVGAVPTAVTDKSQSCSITTKTTQNYAIKLEDSNWYAENGKYYTYVTISNTGDGILSLTDLKIAYNTVSKPAGKSVRLLVNRDMLNTLPTVDESLTFGANLVLENDLTMNFRVRADKLAAYDLSTAYLVVERDIYESGAKEAFVETVTIREYQMEGGRLIFSYPGIAAAQMNDAIRATLYVKTERGKEYYSTTLNTSVATYLNGLLTSSASDTKLITLLMDMVNYGAAAQIYFDRHADAPVNEAFESFKTYASYASADFKTALENLSATENAEGKSGKLNLGLDLGTRIGIQYKVTVPTDVNVEDVTLVVTDASGNVLETLTVAGNPTDSKGRYVVNFYGFTSRDMRRVVYATAYAKGEAITGTYAYSISTYAWGVQENAGLQPENLVNVTRAMMLYGDSAAAYFA